MKSRLTRVTVLGAALLVAGWAFAQLKSDAAEDASPGETTCSAAGGACCATASACCAAKSECGATAECSAVAKKKPPVLCPVSGVALKTCPVSGKPTQATLVSYQGGKVFLRCESCAAEFKKDTAKYATKANLQLVATGQARQIACPFSGKKTDGERVVEVAGLKVAVCCGGCAKKLETAKAKDQIELVFGKKAFAKGFALKKSGEKENKTEVAQKG